eukprot:1158921-Pelagomonas_calceolata.AAC.3
MDKHLEFISVENESSVSQASLLHGIPESSVSQASLLHGIPERSVSQASLLHGIPESSVSQASLLHGIPENSVSQASLLHAGCTDVPWTETYSFQVQIRERVENVRGQALVSEVQTKQKGDGSCAGAPQTEAPGMPAQKSERCMNSIESARDRYLQCKR